MINNAKEPGNKYKIKDLTTVSLSAPELVATLNVVGKKSARKH